MSRTPTDAELPRRAVPGLLAAALCLAVLTGCQNIGNGDSFSSNEKSVTQTPDRPAATTP